MIRASISQSGNGLLANLTKIVAPGAKRNRKGAKVKLIPLSFGAGISGEVRRTPDETLAKVGSPAKILISVIYDDPFRNRDVLGREFRSKNVSGVPSKLLPESCQMVQVRR
jgi:hypothetical protein